MLLVRQASNTIVYGRRLSILKILDKRSKESKKHIEGEGKPLSKIVWGKNSPAY